MRAAWRARLDEALTRTCAPSAALASPPGGSRRCRSLDVSGYICFRARSPSPAPSKRRVVLRSSYEALSVPHARPLLNPASAAGRERRAVSRTRAAVRFGSPLQQVGRDGGRRLRWRWPRRRARLAPGVAGLGRAVQPSRQAACGPRGACGALLRLLARAHCGWPAQDVALRAAPADGQRASDAAGGGGALSSAPKPGQSRLGGVASPPPGAAAAAGAPGADAPSQPRKPQFVPKVPVERPRAAAARDTGGQRGDAAAAPDEQRGNRQLQELIRQTEADAARVDARKGAGRGRGRGVAADAPPPVASLAPVTLGAAAGAPRAASAPTGDEKVTRRGRPARAQEEARPAFAAVAMDVDDEDDAVDEHKPRDPIAWLDKQRYYPTVLPFAAPLEDASATPAAGTSPLADLGLVDGTPDGRLLLVQLPVRAPGPLRTAALQAAVARACVAADAAPGPAAQPAAPCLRLI